MSRREIKRRLKLALATDEQIEKVFDLMKGFSDKDCEVNGKHNQKWAQALKQVFE